MEKIKVRQGKLEDITGYISGPIHNLEKRLAEVVKKYENLGYSDLCIDVEYDYDNTTVYISGQRDETQIEYQRRMAAAARIAERELKNKAAKRKLYESLKKEFES